MGQLKEYGVSEKASSDSFCCLHLGNLKPSSETDSNGFLQIFHLPHIQGIVILKIKYLVIIGMLCSEDFFPAVNSLKPVRP